LLIIRRHAATDHRLVSACSSLLGIVGGPVVSSTRRLLLRRSSVYRCLCFVVIVSIFMFAGGREI
jgi:hypothetical protein